MSSSSTRKASSTTAASFHPSRMEETWNQQLDSELDQLLENFGHILKASKMMDKDKYLIAREKYQIELHTHNIVRSIEKILGMISELRLAFIINDFPKMNQQGEEQKKSLHFASSQYQEQMKQFHSTLRSLLTEMESIYYQ